MPTVSKTLLSILVLFLCSCGSMDVPPDSAIDCGSQFIKAVNNGNFKRARQLMEPSEANEKKLQEIFIDPFRQLDGFGKQGLSESSIEIITIKEEPKRGTHITFTNNLSHQPLTITILSNEDQYLVSLAESNP